MPAARPRVAPAPAPHRPALARHIPDDRRRDRDLFCPRPTDPKAPVRFSAYLEKQNRERPDFKLGAPALVAGCPAEGPGRDVSRPPATPDPRLSPEEPPRGTRQGGAGAGPARIGDVFPTPRQARAADVTVHYVIHRPIPSGMTIDVFA